MVKNPTTGAVEWKQWQWKSGGISANKRAMTLDRRRSNTIRVETEGGRTRRFGFVVLS